MKRIDGFDYVAQRPVSLSRKEWIMRIADAQKCGGRRRVEQGETFIHSPTHMIMAEVYAILPAVRS